MNVADNEIGHVAWITSDRKFKDFLEVARTAEVFVYDLETTGLDEWAVSGGRSNGGVAARVSMLSATVKVKDQVGKPITYIMPLSHPRSPFLGVWRARLRELADVLLRAKAALVAHNAKFDMRWVHATTGVDLTSIFHWDTQVAAYLMDENNSTRLKEVVPRIFGVERWDEHDLSYPGASEDVDYWELGEYAAKDTWFTWLLYDYQRGVMFLKDYEDMPSDHEEVQDARIGTLAVNVAMPTVAALAKMEQRGFMLDLEWVSQELSERREIAQRTLLELSDEFGLDPAKASTAATSGWFTELTNLAIERGDLKVIATTATGRPQWSKDVFEKLQRQGSTLAGKILEQRQAAKSSEFLSSWLDKAAPDGAIHATYNVGRVVSGRLSSSDPNMQQVTKALRPAFIPRPGHVIIDLDYSQLELRVAAFISRSMPMIEAFQRGDDLHALLAARINKIDPSQVTPAMRQAAKAGNFGFLFGQEPYGFQFYAESGYGVILSEEEAVDIYNEFFDTWAGMREWHQASKERVRRQGYVVSPIGRVRRLPDAQGERAPFTTKLDRQAINSPVQGFGADLMNMATASISGFLHGFAPIPNAFPVASVHDSSVNEAPEDNWQEVAEAIAARMRDLDIALKRMGVDFDVPLEVEYEVGTRWGLSDVGRG